VLNLSPCSKFIIKDLATVLVGGPAEPTILGEWREQQDDDETPTGG
jgi:hypothetical protein